MEKNKTYTEKDIVVLSDREHVRMRLPIYFGSIVPTTVRIPIFAESLVLSEFTFIPAAYKAVGEIIDNCIDEFSHLLIKNKELTIVSDTKNGYYSIKDNGRGVPIGKMETGQHTPEVVFGSLRSGRNFKDEKVTGVIGQNGIGAAATAYTSTLFKIEIVRDGKEYIQEFSNGVEIIHPPTIKKTNKRETGTTISFSLDPEVYKDVELPSEVMRNRAIEVAFNNPNTTVFYNNEKFNFKNGLEDVVKKISNEYFRFGIEGFEFFVILDQYKGQDEQVFTWVNSSLLYDGGMCNTQFVNAFVDATVEHLRKDAKKLGAEVTKNDIRQNLLVLGSLKISDPVYDSQSKTRLIGPNLRKELDNLISSGWSLFSKRNKEWLSLVLERANERHHTNANKKASEEFKKTLKKKVPGLLDAVGRERMKCKLFITEGLSAASSLVEVRDPGTIGSFPLGGKINNVYGSTVAQVLQMGKLKDLLAAIGLVPGQKVYKQELRFGKGVVIATDADPDGSDIITTLVCLFYEFWPELFDPKQPPYFYRLIAPNVCAVKGNKRVHFTTKKDYEKQRDKYKGWTISYFKGLGSMEKEDWEMIINDERFYLPIIGDSNMKDVMKLLFSEDSQARKDWLSTKTEDI
jgi:DNA gyrase/topoisomerase IV subunit B